MEEKKKISAYQKLVEGIEKITSSGQYKDFLKFMKNFHNYSFNNKLLIFTQNADATMVAGYRAWQKMGRGVKSNPKKIFILKPIPYTINRIETNETEPEEIKGLKFGWTLVYDISDTYIKDDSKEIPLLDNITLNNNSSKELHNALLEVSPVKVFTEDTGLGLDGYYSKEESKIVISSRLSEDDATATLLHEISHALYDEFDYKKDRDLSEIFVESIAFVTADYFGLDTSKCSFPYITKWCNGEPKKLLELGSKIQEASDKLIDLIENKLEIQIERVA